MNRRLALFALALAVIGIVWLSRRGERGPSSTTRAPEPDAVASGPDEALREPERAVEPAEPMDESGDRRAPVVAPAAPERDPEKYEIRGRFVFASGEPAPGVVLRCDWDKVFESAADGTFSIPFADDDNPNVWAELPGYAAFQWEWFGPEPGQVIDLGEVVVERGGTIRARIVDREGRTLTKGWRVEAQVEARSFPDGRDDDSQVFALAAGEDGTFVLDHVRCGRVRLRADSDLGSKVDGPTLVVRDGDAVDLEIPYGGPDNAKRITVSLDLERFWWLDLSPEIRLSGPGVEPRSALEVEHRVQTFSFDDLPPGTYVVEIEDPRLTPWRADGVAPGTFLQAEVKGSSILALRIIDGETGEELHDYGAVLRLRNVSFSPAEFDLFEDGAKPPADGVIDGIVPGDSTLVISAPGLAPVEVEIEDLAPRERREVVARLGRGAEIAGTLVHADGKPVPKAEVRLLEADGGDMDWFPEDLALEETDARGRFEFPNLAPGRYEVRGGTSSLLEIGERVEVVGGETTEVRLALPAESFAMGVVLGPSGASFEGMSIVLLEAPSAGEATLDVTDGPRRELEVELARDGVFRIGPVHPGNYVVLLQLSEEDEVPLGSTVMVLQGARREIGRVALEAGENPDRAVDARAVWPGTLVVQARGDASLLSGAVVSFQGREGGQVCRGFAELGRDGEVQLAPLFPGRYGIVVGGADQAWGIAALELCSLAASGTAHCEIDVVLASGDLRITEQDLGEPAAGRSILLVPRDPILDAFGFVLSFDTDLEGVLRATVAPGTYAVLDGGGPIPFGPNDLDLPTVHWTPAGPDPAEVSIPRLDGGDADSGDR